MKWEDKLPSLVKEICQKRELAECWFLNDDLTGDCGNWTTCQPGCPLKQLRDLVGIVPQEDGGMDKQPTREAAEAAREGETK